LNMDKFYKTAGIVLKKRNWREDDLLFSIFTENFGRVEALAVGARKIKSKLAGHLAAPGIIDFIFVAGRLQKRITHACVRCFWPMRDEIDYQFWNCFTELLDKFSHEEKDERLWRLAIRFFERIANVDGVGSKKLFLNLFIIKMLAVLGYDILKAKKSEKLTGVFLKLSRVPAHASVKITSNENDYLFQALRKYLLFVGERPIKSLEYIC